MATEDISLNLILIEDHDILRQMLQQALEEAGHSVIALSCAEELEDVAGGQNADLFLIDLNLPGEDGLSLVERLRAAYPLTGLIIITARPGLEAKLDGYARGADLYLSKPFEVQELCAAVAALGRRRQRVDKIMNQGQTDELTVHQQAMTIKRPHQEPVALTASEAAILVAISRAPGQRLAYWQVAETLGFDLEIYPKASLEVRIARLRKKLVSAGAPPHCIESVRNHGYQLCIPLQIV